MLSPVVYLFGASCSGKSTLCQALQKELGSAWDSIDLDDLIEQGFCSDSTSSIVLEEKVQSACRPLIIDAQIPWRDKKVNELYFVLLPPLSILLERDEKRTKNLQRSEKRAYHAKEYVKETYDILYHMTKTTRFDYRFESIEVSIEEKIDIIKNFIFNQLKSLHSK